MLSNNQYLSFVVADTHYAISVNPIIEIIALPSIVAVPDTPSFVRGVFDYRGKVAAAIDLRRRLGLLQQHHDAKNCLLILELNQLPVGVIVEKVNDVITIDRTQIESIGLEQADTHGLVSARAISDGRVHLLLDTQRLLDIVTRREPYEIF